MSETTPTRYVAIDVETPNHRNNRISAIGYAVLDGCEVLDSGSYLVNPEVEFDRFNIDLTGISPATVKDAPTFPQVWAQIAPLLEGAVFVAHNARFDLSVISKTASAYHIQMPQMQYLCTLDLTRTWIPDSPGHRLNDICDYLQIPLNHHQADSDAMACAMILYHLASAGIPVGGYVATYDYQAILQHWAQRKPKLSKQSEEINELLDLLEAAAEDGVITEQEALVISGWCHGHAELAGNYPYDRIIAALQTVLEDGVLEKSELEELLVLFRQIIDPVNSAPDCSAGICLDGRQICLTGEFDHGARAEIEAILKGQGAIIRKSIVKKLDYLIVGGQGSSAWAAGNYGNKVKQALELQGTGAAVQIIREADLFAALEANV